MATTAPPAPPPASTHTVKPGIRPLRPGVGHSFLWRRLHSLSGIVPIGAFLLEHLLSNFEALQRSIADGNNRAPRTPPCVHAHGKARDPAVASRGGPLVSLAQAALALRHRPHRRVPAGASPLQLRGAPRSDRKSTRLNSSHLGISYAVFCLKK